jgi:hypothetical protein
MDRKIVGGVEFGPFAGTRADDFIQCIALATDPGHEPISLVAQLAVRAAQFIGGIHLAYRDGIACLTAVDILPAMVTAVAPFPSMASQSARNLVAAAT